MADINNNLTSQYMENNNSSGTNTILIVVVLLILVGFGVWWFTVRGGSAPEEGVNVDVTLPGSDEGASVE